MTQKTGRRDEQTELYVPVIYVLVTGKLCTYYAKIVLTTNKLNTKTTGKKLMGLLACILLDVSKNELEFDPVYIYLDFEKALINAAKDQFKDAILIGFFFNFKQALRRCIMLIGMLIEQVKIEMTEN